MTKLAIVKGLVEQMREPKKVYYIWEDGEEKEVDEAYSHEYWTKDNRSNMSYPYESWENNYTPTRLYEECKEVRRLLADIERKWGFNK